MSDYIIKVENLGKKYRIHHQQDGQRYVALRDVIAEKLTAPLHWFCALDPMPHYILVNKIEKTTVQRLLGLIGVNLSEIIRL